MTDVRDDVRIPRSSKAILIVQFYYVISTESGYTREAMTMIVKQSKELHGIMNIDGRQSISFSQTIRNNFVCAVHVLTTITKKKRCLSSGQEVNRIHVVKMEDTEIKPLVRL